MIRKLASPIQPDYSAHQKHYSQAISSLDIAMEKSYLDTNGKVKLMVVTMPPIKELTYKSLQLVMDWT